MWPVVQLYFSNMSHSVQLQLQSGYQVLPPHPAGGIHVNENFEHLAGTIQISGSKAKHGGAVLRSSSGVFGRILRWLQALGDQL